MIKLKNGVELQYTEDFDVFFQNLLESMIRESRKTALNKYSPGKSDESLNDFFLKELMDNCIYVTHQLFEMSKINEEFSKFIITGFIFNSTVLSLSQFSSEPGQDGDGEDRGKIH